VVRPDQVSLGVLVAAVPRDAVDAAVAQCGVREMRLGGSCRRMWWRTCAVRRFVLFPIQSEGTRRDVLGSDGSPESERRPGTIEWCATTCLDVFSV